MKLSIVVFLVGLMGVALATSNQKDAANQLLRLLLRKLVEEEETRKVEVRAPPEPNPALRGLTFSEVTDNGNLLVWPQIDVGDPCYKDENPEDCWFVSDCYTMTGKSVKKSQWTTLEHAANWNIAGLTPGDWYRVSCCRVPGNQSISIVQDTDGEDVCKDNYCQIPEKQKNVLCQKDDPNQPFDPWAGIDLNALFGDLFGKK